MGELASVEDMINWRTLYVSNIDRQATKSEIKMDLQVLCPRDLGAVVVPVDQVDTTTLGIAYCNFKLASDAADALSRYRFGTRISGKLVSIAYSVVKDRTKILGPWGNRLTIIIKNLSPEVTEKKLCAKFEQFGNIFRCKVDCDSTGCKYGMAQYTKESSTIRAVQCANNQTWFSTVIKVERHAKTYLCYGDLAPAPQTPSRAPEATTAVASQIEPGGHSHVGPVVPTASKVDNWSSESNPWACVHPPPLPPQTRPSSSHPPAHHLEPSIQEDRPVSSPFVTASDDYEVTINGTDFQSCGLADEDIHCDVVEKSSSSSSTAEQTLATSPEMGIIGLMTEQRKRYTEDTAEPTKLLAKNRYLNAYTTHTSMQSSQGTDFMWTGKESAGLQGEKYGRSSGFDSAEKPPAKPAVRHMNVKEAMQSVSQVEVALRALLGPLERITGYLHGEGLLCCPITQEMFEDPVVAADGYTYERSAIQDWLQRRNTSPYTNLVLSHTNVTPNTLVKNIVEEIKFQWK